MSEERYKSFAEFWPFYVGEHSKVGTRLSHYIGSIIALATLFTTIATGHPGWFWLSFIGGYGGAWIGHFFIEKNRPATFKYPLWSFMADWKMNALAVRGRMKDEVARLAPQKVAQAEQVAASMSGSSA